MAADSGGFDSVPDFRSVFVGMNVFVTAVILGFPVALISSERGFQLRW